MTCTIQIHALTHHVVFVLDEDAEFLEERDDENDQLDIVTVECFDEQAHDALVAHFQLHLEVLRQIQQQVVAH